MAVYKLLLDESGSFNGNDERYIIIGGIFFEEKFQDDFEKIFLPLHRHLCDVFNVDELHASENKEYYKYVAPIIGSIDNILPVIFVIDKQKSFIFRKYNEISFKYNKAIEHLIKRMLANNMLKETDELYIKIDNINLSDYSKKNLDYYLPNKYSFVKNIKQVDSKENICVQFADLIVNRFSKKTKCKKTCNDIKLLNPKIYCFLDETTNDYIKE